VQDNLGICTLPAQVEAQVEASKIYTVEGSQAEACQSIMAHTQPGDLVGAASWIAAKKERDEETAQRELLELWKRKKRRTAWNYCHGKSSWGCEEMVVKIVMRKMANISISLYIYRYIQHLYTALDLKPTVVVVRNCHQQLGRNRGGRRQPDITLHPANQHHATSHGSS
jgi:hypothetical protein